MKIENEFIPYKQALALKKIGFDEKCLYSFEYGNSGLECKLNPQLKTNSSCDIGEIVAPLYQQAFKFFRENHNLDSWIYCPNKSKGYFAIILKHKRFVSYNEQFDTYEEAELACLNKLIEIVKNGNKS